MDEAITAPKLGNIEDGNKNSIYVLVFTSELF
jgi:hypothetical protein